MDDSLAIDDVVANGSPLVEVRETSTDQELDAADEGSAWQHVRLEFRPLEQYHGPERRGPHH